MTISSIHKYTTTGLIRRKLGVAHVQGGECSRWACQWLSNAAREMRCYSLSCWLYGVLYICSATRTASELYTIV
eukprot:1673898-Pleurochrysis_carterae.AAC.1